MLAREVPQSNVRSISQSAEFVAGVGAAFLASIYLLAAYGTGAADPPALLDFVFENVLDCLAPISVALWVSDRKFGWVRKALAGGEMQLPPGYETWADFNRESFKRQRVGSTSTHDSTTQGIQPVHWTAPVIFPGATCHVLHVVGSAPQEISELVEPFLRLVAHHVVQPLERHGGDFAVARTNGAITDGSHLSVRQNEVLRFLALDLTYHQISKRMGYSESTVKQEAMKIFKTLGVSNRKEAAQKI